MAAALARRGGRKEMDMAEYTFDPVQARDTLIANLKEFAAQTHFDKVVLGISGGKDSTVCAALCARAFGADHVYGVMMPDGVQKDIADSQRVCDVLGINQRVVNIGAMHQDLHAAVLAADEGFPVEFSVESDINVGPRLRMTTLRYITQAIGARLVGTGNKSEATVGYCTKDGDTSCDFALLATLTSVEVVQVGLTMEELPRELVEKPPTDGLSGKTDEEKLGLLYSDIHKYIRFGTCGDPDIDAKIAAKERGSAHKRSMPHVIQSGM